MPEPFSVEHFRGWSRDLILDNGKPFEPEPWQEAFLADVFAGFREAWLVVPEGNGKTTLLAALALYHCEYRPDAWVPTAASSRDQARILYRQAKGFVKRSHRLDKVFRCYDGYRRISHVDNGSQIEIFAGDDRTGDGVIPTLCLIDELHRHRNLDLYLTWTGKLGKRDGQIATISTAGEPGGEFEQTRERLRQADPDAQRRPGFGRFATAGAVLHEWALPEGADAEDFGKVKLGNPFSAVTIEELRRKRARESMTLQHWLRFNCNVATRAENAAIQEAEWFAARSMEQIPAGQPVWVGADIAWKWDTTAIVPLWWKSDTFRLLGPAKVLVPPRDGSSLDPAAVERAFIDIHHRNPIHTVVMDSNKAEQLGSWLEAELGATVIDRAQTHPEATKDFEKFMEALRSGWLKHSGDRELTSHALNAIARVLPYGDARFDRPSRSRSGDQDRRVIDALIAAAMAHREAATKQAPEPSVYEVRGLDAA